MMKHTTMSLLLLSSLIACTSAPGTANKNTSTTPEISIQNVSFTKDIQPIMTSYCTACHSGSQSGSHSHATASVFEEHDLDLQAEKSYNNLVNQKSKQDTNATLVIPGDSAKSLLYQKLSQSTPPVGVRMPEGSMLTANEIALFKAWIDQGAKNN